MNSVLGTDSGSAWLYCLAGGLIVIVIGLIIVWTYLYCKPRRKEEKKESE
jgi:cbb3-type cytochrome oxidase subunit 3